MTLRALFIGLGSIGCRHIKNLKELLPDVQIEAIRSSNRTLTPEISCLLTRQHTDTSTLEGEFDLCFITNPTHLHREAIELTMPFAKSYFIEKPIFEKADILPFNDNRPVYVAAPLRHTKLYGKLCELLSAEKPLAARAICSSYLPGWRPGTDYTKCYSAIKKYGGGVRLDLIHEWDYLKALFGEVDRISCFYGNASQLNIDSEDYAVYIAVASGVPITLHLDYFGKQYSRSCEIICEGGTIKADFYTGFITHYSKGEIDCSEDGNERYKRELKHYLDVVAGGNNINDSATATATLKIVLAEVK